MIKRLPNIIYLLLLFLLGACQSTSIPNINHQNDIGWSALHMTASGYYIPSDEEGADIVDVMIKKGAEVDLADDLGDTPLVVAITNNRPLTIDALLKHQANININAFNARSPLMRATYLNNYPIVKKLIEHNVDLNLSSENGWTALHIASSLADNKRDFGVAELLINAGANIEAKNKDLCTPLTLAVLNNKPVMVEVLLSASADINTRDKNGWTPLMHAAANANLPLINTLLAHKADITINTYEGWSVLHVVASSSNNASDKVKASIAQRLIAAGAPINHLNNKKRSALHLAASSIDLPQTIEVLFAGGALLDQPDKYGWTPLMRAIHLEREKSIQTLIRLGANIEAVDNNGWTALHHAVSPLREDKTAKNIEFRNKQDQETLLKVNNLNSFLDATKENIHVSIIKTLMQHGANIEARNQKNRTPLYVAVIYDEVILSAYLLYLGADVNAYAYKQWTPFYRAISQGNLTLVELMLSFKPNVTHKTQNLGWSALLFTTNNQHKAYDSQQAKMVPLLLKAGCDLESSTYSGLTAVMNAAENGKLAVLKALVANGANIYAVNPNNNKSALDYASKANHPHIVEYLKSIM